MSDFADSRRDRIVDDQQVVVGVERQFVGIERSFSLPRRLGQRFRIEPRRCKSCSSERCLLYHLTSVKHGSDPEWDIEL